MRNIPNIITSLNLVSGFLAIICLFSGEQVAASWLIVAAMIFDFLDGLASRLLNAFSVMGKELDSLADMVSFGVVPGITMYLLLSESINPGGNREFSLSLSAESILPLSAVLIPLFAGLRLARFNIDPDQKNSFRGLPTPAAALAVISLVLAERYSDSLIINSFVNSAPSLAVFSIVLASLMLIRIPLISLKFSNFKLKGNEGRYILIVVGIFIVVTSGFGGLPWLIPAYITVSLILSFF